jgi:voltage-gated potassium channel
MATADLVPVDGAGPTAGGTLTPGEEVCLLVAGSAALFYWAEKDENPGVKDYWDALHYVTTSLSVGYANLFPVTALGKLLASTLMTVGPALAARTLDSGPPANELGDKLDEVVAQLKQLNARIGALAPGG